MSRLEKGEIIVTATQKKGFAVPLIKAVGIIKVSPAKVWAIVEKCANYKNTMLRTIESEELSRKGGKIRCRVKIDMPFPLDDLEAITNITHTEKDGVYKRVWKHHGGDFTVNRGSWTLKPYNDGKWTVATYKVLTVPKIEIPAVIRNAAQKKTIPGLFKNLRKQLE